ncbi:MAG: IS110 family transposase [Acidimicrobiales bacterium]|jgi:transposase
MEREYVGIDLHRRRSVIVRLGGDGDQRSSVRIDNDPGEFAAAVCAAPAGSDVIIEATYGWYWAADLLQDLGYRVHLANPHGNDWGHRRVKNDERDAHDLADLLRLGRLAECWIAPPETRELRELVRFRAKLSCMRTGAKAQAHAVLAKNGVLPLRNDMWGVGGAAQFDTLEVPRAYSHRIEVLRDLVCFFNREILEIDRQTHRLLRHDPGYKAVPAIYGVGEVMAAIFVAEIGDVTRFSSPEALCSWAGLTPIHRESDTKVHRGRITKQGSRLVRWAAVETVARYHGGIYEASFQSIAERRGKNKAAVAIARKVLTLVYYGLRDGEIRCLASPKAA